MRPRVLLILDHAPDYREPFLKLLGASVDLTVVAKPCSDGLVAPAVRTNYNYIEIPEVKVAGVRWQPGVRRVFSRTDWDAVCCSINLRHLDRLVAFFASRRIWSRWVWRGHVFGRSQSEFSMKVRGYLLRNAAACLVYNEEIADTIRERFGVEAVSFNNTEVEEDDFHPGQFSDTPEIRLLFVGRHQERKKLDRLVALAERCSNVHVRFVGPEMDRLSVPQHLIQTGRVAIFGQTRGAELKQHFDWADLVASPGHVGLLVMNAARYGKGIVIDENSRHAPEYLLARESNQPFISFGQPEEEDRFLTLILDDPELTRKWGRDLQLVARQKYTIEAMVDSHVGVFEAVAHAADDHRS